MSRILNVGAAQLGPVAIDESRASVVQRMISLLREASAAGCRLVVFPELALTTFFPRYYFENIEATKGFFEHEMPGTVTQALFDEARRLSLGFYLGYAEAATENGMPAYYNTSILVNERGLIVGKYRKVHLPGHHNYILGKKLQHLEKRYFQVGNLGFPVWDAFDTTVGMAICNDRRWPETYRVMALQGAEMILLGYNTPAESPDTPQFSHLQMFHNHLSMQSGAYNNSCWVVAAAKAGIEDGVQQIAGSCIINPAGEIVSVSQTSSDEMITFACDLNLARFFRETTFDFARHRQIKYYKLISERIGRAK